MKWSFICLLLILNGVTIQAQLPPWNTKFIVYHPDGYTDTIWVGCDSDATDGYDNDLDILDELLLTPFGIGIYNQYVEDELGTSTCSNLEKDIRPFQETVSFDFYLVHGSILVLDTIYLGWDTSNLNYEVGEYKIEGAKLSSENGYLLGIDGYEYVFCSREADGGEFDIHFQPIPVFVLGEILACIPDDTLFVLKLNLEVYFKDYSLPVTQIFDEDQITIHPNPTNDILLAHSNIKENVFAEVFSIDGSIEFEQNLDYGQNLIKTDSLPSGLYIISFYLSNCRRISSYQFTKL